MADAAEAPRRHGRSLAQPARRRRGDRRDRGAVAAQGRSARRRPGPRPAGQDVRRRRGGTFTRGQARRIRLAPIADFSAATLKPFVAATTAPGARVVTDGWSGHVGLPDHAHDPKVVGKMAAQVVLRWTHRVFSNLKRWALGTLHGLRRLHVKRYLDELVFRWNRRRHTAAAFATLLGLGARLEPATERDFMDQRV